MQTIVFRSKIDRWLSVILIGAIALSLGTAIMVTWLDGRGVMALIPLVLLGAAFPLWVMLTTDYTLTASELRVRSGPFRWRVPLHEIRSITPTHNPLSSPALSLDRLRIDYGSSKWLMISPKDKDLFLREIEARRSAVGGRV